MTTIVQDRYNPYQRMIDQTREDLENVDWDETWQKTKEVADFVFKATIATLLCWTNPTLFFLGGIVGIVKIEAVGDMIDKITTVWKYQVGVIACGLAFGAFMGLPVALAYGAFIVGGGIGRYLSIDSQKKKGTYKEFHTADIQIIVRGDEPFHINLNMGETARVIDIRANA